MKWLKRLWQLYMKGARENDFPISEYGLFGEKKKTNKIQERTRE